jgi:ubiquinone/menaquinone biosynthesis C-methylase UbiE
MEELVFERQAAAEYDRAFAHVTRYFMPFVLRAARIARGMRVLDIAAGTGLSAEAALSAVGPTGHVTAADVSPAMAEKARERLGESRNASVLVEDAQALSFSDEIFDAVVCNLGLMFFLEPARGLSEFRRVLRPGRRAAVSVNTVPERSYNHQINVILTRYVPGLAEAVTRTFSLGEASRLEELFRECGFSQIEIRTVKHTLCATKCGATSATRAGQSRSRPSTESPVAGVRRRRTRRFHRLHRRNEYAGADRAVCLASRRQVNSCLRPSRPHRNSAMLVAFSEADQLRGGPAPANSSLRRTGSGTCLCYLLCPRAE